MLPPDNTPAATILIMPLPPVRQLFTRLTYSGDSTTVAEPAYFRVDLGRHAAQRLSEQMLPLFSLLGLKTKLPENSNPYRKSNMSVPPQNLISLWRVVRERGGADRADHVIL